MQLIFPYPVILCRHCRRAFQIENLKIPGNVAAEISSEGDLLSEFIREKTLHSTAKQFFKSAQDGCPIFEYLWMYFSDDNRFELLPLPDKNPFLTYKIEQAVMGEQPIKDIYQILFSLDTEIWCPPWGDMTLVHSSSVSFHIVPNKGKTCMLQFVRRPFTCMMK